MEKPEIGSTELYLHKTSQKVKHLQIGISQCCSKCYTTSKVLKILIYLLYGVN